MRLLLAAAVLSVLLIGCTPATSPTATPTQPLLTATAAETTTKPLAAAPIVPPTPTLTATATPPWKPGATPQMTPGPTKPQGTPVIPRIEARVTRVIDGDTIEVKLAGKVYSVHYIGVDTPETVDSRKPVHCFGQAASAKNRKLVSGQTVHLEKDVSDVDKYDRLLRYVYVRDMMVNAELVRLGYARASSYAPDVKYQDQFSRLQREAEEAGRGLWAPTACATPVPPATAPKPAPDAPAN